MNRTECVREPDVLDAVASGRWPERLDIELHNHLSDCRICSEVVQISCLYREDSENALLDARVPSAGLVWWKSELRARREAVRTASRPIALVQTGAITSIIGLLLVAFAYLSFQFDLSTIASFLKQQPLALWLAVGVVIALTPIAIYFVCSDE